MSIRNVLWIALALSGAGVAAGQMYPAGFVWSRAADWTPRPVSDENTSNGNPDDDAAGRPAWVYEYSELPGGAGPIGSPSPWYEPGNSPVVVPMVWDSRYQGTSLQAWSRQLDTGPFMTSMGMFHLLQPPNRGYVPMIRFAYPGACRATVRVTGTLMVIWTGIQPALNQSPDDVALVVWRAGRAESEPIVLRHVTRPVGSDTYAIPVDATVDLLPGDSIVLTHMGTMPDIRNWNYLSDSLAMTLVANGPAFDQPAAESITCAGGEARVRVAARGSELLTYRWRRNGVALVDGATGFDSFVSGSTSAELVIKGVGDHDTASYDCVVTGACGTAVSSASVVRICASDLNCDRTVDLLDFFEFLNCWDLGWPCADVTRDAQVDLADFFGFFQGFDLGC